MKYYFSKSGELNLNGNEEWIETKQSGISPMNFVPADFWLAASLLICGFLYWNFVIISKMGVGVTAFAMILCSITLIYFKARGITQTKNSTLWLVLTQVSAVQFMLFDGYAIKCVNLFFTSICFIYWVTVSTGRCLEAKLSIYTIWDLLNQIGFVPFANITCEYCSLKRGISKNKHSKNVMYVLVGIVVFFPLMAFVVNQLSSADAAFEELLNRIMQAGSINTILIDAMQFVVGIPVAGYLFGLIYGNSVGRNTEGITKAKIIQFTDDISFAPKVTVYTAMTIFNIIYVIFFASQMAYFLSAFENVLPDTFTYAEYARRGFFELCKVSAVNMGIIVMANIFITKKEIKQKPKILRIQTAFMSIMTIGLIVTALRKMYMYIQSYGLTQLRVYTSWFMVMLLFTFAVILLRQMKDFNASKIVIIGGIIGFMILSYGNVDGNVAKYNIKNYENGNLEKLDYNTLFKLSDAAVPDLCDFYEKTDDVRTKDLLYNYIVYGNEKYGESEDYESDERDELYGEAEESDSDFEEYDGYEDYEGREEEKEKANSFKNFNFQSSRANSVRIALQNGTEY